MIRTLLTSALSPAALLERPQRWIARATPGARSWTSRLTRTSFWRHQVKKRITLVLRLLTDWALFILVVLTGGFGSAYYMIDRGSGLSTITSGPWTMWSAAARTDMDPYTRAHFARVGSLPLSSEIAQTWLARTDETGATLHSSCDYEITFQVPESSWWSLAVFDAEGRLIPNPAERYVFTSQTATISPDGRFVGLLSRAAGAGNWLPTTGAGNLNVMFTVIDMGVATGAADGERDYSGRVPAITPKGCR